MVTGFLGAGKTTFLNNAARAFQNQRIALIVNEYGKQGVDGALLADKGYQVTEITNGSIFCVCRMDIFMSTLIQVANSSAEILIVETSGLSNPTHIEEMLRHIQAAGVLFDYRGCICLVDAVHFHKVCYTATVVPDQVRQSSLVVINKVDLVDEEQINRIEKLILTLNPSCALYRSVYADVPPDMFMRLAGKPEQVLGGKQDIVSGSLTFTVLYRPGKSSFSRLIDGIKPFIYRAKGYAALTDGDYFIDGVMEDVRVTRTEAKHTAGIVLLYPTSGNVKSRLHRLAAEHQIQITLL
jgi:G3E family GTPase